MSHKMPRTFQPKFKIKKNVQVVPEDPQSFIANDTIVLHNQRHCPLCAITPPVCRVTEWEEVSLRHFGVREPESGARGCRRSYRMPHGSEDHTHFTQISPLHRQPSQSELRAGGGELKEKQTARGVNDTFAAHTPSELSFTQMLLTQVITYRPAQNKHTFHVMASSFFLKDIIEFSTV